MTAWLPSWCRVVLRLLGICLFGVKKISENARTTFLPGSFRKPFPHSTIKIDTTCSPAWTIGFCVLAIFFSLNTSAFANNVAVENAELADQASSADTIQIEFDISWGNSWRDSVNHDAVWVFAKYCTSNCSTSGTWSHATLNVSGTNPSGFDDGTKQAGSAYTALTIVVPSDKKGAFFFGANNGSGTADFHDAQLVWNYAQDGVTDSQASDSTNTKIRVYGIEMTYIPEEGFYAGDGSAGTQGEFEFAGSAASEPGAINSEGGLSFGTATTQWYYNTDTGGSEDDASGTVFEVTEAFPKGFQAIYLMKYEMSQGQYRDFLNTLTQGQQATRTAAPVAIAAEAAANIYVMVSESETSVVNRQVIKAGSNPAAGNPYTFGCDLDDDNTSGESADGEWIAMNYISWMDLMAYSDWAGLRPFTELEYEKACRGPLSPVDGEYPWGTTSATQATGAIQNSGQISEVANATGNGLANYDGAGTDIAAPIRSGFAATSSTSTRIAAGAGYYGNMDLAGNLWETMVTIGNATGRGFSGTQGDGNLETNGNASNPDWPGWSSGNGVNGATGSGIRGAAYNGVTTNMVVSDRQYAAVSNATRQANRGGRLARTAS